MKRQSRQKKKKGAAYEAGRASESVFARRSSGGRCKSDAERNSDERQSGDVNSAHLQTGLTFFVRPAPGSAVFREFSHKTWERVLTGKPT